MRITVEITVSEWPELTGEVDETDSEERAECDGWEAFLEAWHERFGDRPQRVADVLGAISEDRRFRAALPPDLALGYDLGPDHFRKRLGRALGRRERHPERAARWSIIRGAWDSSRKQQRWVVRKRTNSVAAVLQ